MALIVEFERRRGRVVAATPFEDLVLAVLLGGLLLVETLESAVVAFVESPGASDRNPQASHGIEGKICGADGPGLHRGMQHGGGHPGGSHGATGGTGLGAALLGEVGVVPTGEEVLEVPGALTVAEEDQCGRHAGKSASWVHGGLSPRDGPHRNGRPGMVAGECSGLM